MLWNSLKSTIKSLGCWLSFITPQISVWLSVLWMHPQKQHIHIHMAQNESCQNSSSKYQRMHPGYIGRWVRDLHVGHGSYSLYQISSEYVAACWWIVSALKRFSIVLDSHSNFSITVSIITTLNTVKHNCCLCPPNFTSVYTTFFCSADDIEQMLKMIQSEFVKNRNFVPT